MWSFVQRKAHQRWLWHAIDHLTGWCWRLRLGVGRIKSLCSYRRCSSRLVWSTFTRMRPESTPSSSRRCAYGRQTPHAADERKHLTLRTRIKRLARKTICFSKSVFMHDTVIGLFVNRYEFGTPI